MTLQASILPDFRYPHEPLRELSIENVTHLKRVAKSVRNSILTMVTEANSGHVGGSLSSADLLVALYHRVMKHDPTLPRWDERDRFILSKGHCTPVLYATLASCGYFPKSDLSTFRRPGSHLQGHPHHLKTPGVDASTGTLGLGLSTACGMALAARLRKQSQKYFVLCGDGEQQEGQIWEAAMFASKYDLGNLIAFTDRNRLQTDGDTENVMPLEPLAEKWRAFRWMVQEIDGHDFNSIVSAVAGAVHEPNRPHMIICNTTKGKGVSFMENEAKWHGTPPTPDECDQALGELEHAD
jgi:transketolase